MATATDEIYVKIITETKNSEEALKRLSTVYAAVTATISAAIVFSQKLIVAWGQAEKASLQFTFAIKQNPLLNGASVETLGKYADQLAKTAALDDDMIKQQIAVASTFQLTEEQIKAVMKGAVDLAATGMVSLDTAVRSLAGSFEGNIGLIGRYVPALRGLTEDELKAGEAVRIVNERFAGTATALAGGTQGMIDTLKVSLQNLAEAGGRVLNDYINPLIKAITPLIDKMSVFIMETIDLRKAQLAVMGGTANPNQLIMVLEDAIKKYQEEFDKLVTKYGTMKRPDLSPTYKQDKARMGELLDLLKRSQERIDELSTSLNALPKGILDTLGEVLTVPTPDWVVDPALGSVATVPIPTSTRPSHQMGYQSLPGGMGGGIPTFADMGYDLNREDGGAGKGWQEVAQWLKAANEEEKRLSQSTADYYSIMQGVLGTARGIADSLVAGDIAGAMKKMAMAALDALTNQALLAAATAAATGNFLLMTFWLGVAGATVLGSSYLSASGNPTNGGGGGVAPDLPYLSRGAGGGTTVIVQGSVWSEKDLGAAVAASMGRW